MPVDGNSPGICDKGQNDEPRQAQPLWVPELGEADCHPFVTLFGLVFVCAEKSVPPGKGKNRKNQADRDGIEPDDHKVCKPPRLALGVVKVLRGARISPRAIRKKIPKKNPSRIAISVLMEKNLDYFSPNSSRPSAASLREVTRSRLAVTL
jgi:hypothetical protein